MKNEARVIEFGGNLFTIEYDNGSTNVFDCDGSCLFSLNANERLSEFGIKLCLNAYNAGLERGEKNGAILARRDIRVALGIESHDL